MRVYVYLMSGTNLPSWFKKEHPKKIYNRLRGSQKLPIVNLGRKQDNMLKNKLPLKGVWQNSR